jgi:transcriptional regulator with PAS, ATPase and Fis domain
MVEAGTFRRDLYERFTKLTIKIPPLRERAGDFDELLDFFVKEWNRLYQEERTLLPETRELLKRFGWPGNIRQLANVVEELMLLSPTPEIHPGSVPDRVLAALDGRAPELKHKIHLPEEGINLRALLGQIEEEYVREALRRADGKEKAAQILGLNGPALRKALRERLEIGE